MKAIEYAIWDSLSRAWFESYEDSLSYELVVTFTKKPERAAWGTEEQMKTILRRIHRCPMARHAKVVPAEWARRDKGEKSEQ